MSVTSALKTNPQIEIHSYQIQIIHTDCSVLTHCVVNDITMVRALRHAAPWIVDQLATYPNGRITIDRID
jgi:hypothetical protein